jgi:two-component system, NarL family, invasion response regulator UvrY
MKILIADDHPIFRAGLKEALSKDPDVELVGEADDGRKVLELARKRRWDLVVLDLMMPGRDGLEVLQELRRERPKLPILILSAHPEDQLAIRLLKSGAAGFLSKNKAPEILLAAIRKIAGGGKYISDTLAEKVVLEWESNANEAPHVSLSNREYQVLRMVATGMSPKEIARALYLSVRTVSTYRARVLEKMKMKSDAELIRYALKHKIIE